MSTITILGAGTMGSALCTPMVDAGQEVRLWDIWLSDHLLDAVKAGKNHSRTNEPPAQGVKLYHSDELEKILDSANVVVTSVASVGVAKVAELALPGIVKANALWLTSKGLCVKEDGEIQLLPDAVRHIAATQGYDQLPPIVAIAGPVRANECAARGPTATIFGCRDGQVSLQYVRQARSQAYTIEASDDEVGVEICAPMKNVYAIALGIADDLQEATEVPHHDLKAVTFPQAAREMSLLGAALGAKESTIFGLAGVGDLEVTGLSGRNKFYGVRLGRGENPQEALGEMACLEQTVEDVPAVALAQKFVSQKAPNLVEELPLLQAVVRILDGKVEDVKSVVDQAVLPMKP